MAKKWSNYIIKRSVVLKIREIKNNREIAKITGITESYISQIMHGRECTKVMAYAITKCISPTLEINDLFNRLGD